MKILPIKQDQSIMIKETKKVFMVALHLKMLRIKRRGIETDIIPWIEDDKN